MQFKEHLLINNFLPGTGDMMPFNREVKLVNMQLQQGSKFGVRAVQRFPQ